MRMRSNPLPNKHVLDTARPYENCLSCSRLTIAIKMLDIFFRSCCPLAALAPESCRPSILGSCHQGSCPCHTRCQGAVELPPKTCWGGSLEDPPFSQLFSLLHFPWAMGNLERVSWVSVALSPQGGITPIGSVHLSTNILDRLI